MQKNVHFWLNSLFMSDLGCANSVQMVCKCLKFCTLCTNLHTQKLWITFSNMFWLFETYLLPLRYNN